MRCCLVILALATGASCPERAPRTVGFEGPFGETLPPQPQGLPRLEVVLNLEPTDLPDPLRVDHPVVVSIDPVLANGTHCYSCDVAWRSTRPAVAEWGPVQVTGSRQSAELRPMATGDVTLTIDVCPAVGFQCERVVYKRHVVR
jgi:hypothetical protein